MRGRRERGVGPRERRVLSAACRPDPREDPIRVMGETTRDAAHDDGRVQQYGLLYRRGGSIAEGSGYAGYLAAVERAIGLRPNLCVS